MMTKQDYIVLAEAIREGIASADRSEDEAGYGARIVARRIVLVLGRQNPRFDADKFRAACWLDQE